MEHFAGWKFCSRGWSIPMKSLVNTEELCSWSVPLEHVPGAKSLVCIGLYASLFTVRLYHCLGAWNGLPLGHLAHGNGAIWILVLLLLLGWDPLHNCFFLTFGEYPLVHTIIIHSKYFSACYLLAQIPGLILHNQLVLTTFGEHLQYSLKWRH